jgi:hypothetical protein
MFDLLLCWHLVNAQAMLLALSPVALVLTTVRPTVDAITVLQVCVVLTAVGAAIDPAVDSKPRHVIAIPHALIHAAIEPPILPDACDHIVDPVAGKFGTVGPGVSAKPMLSSVRVAAFVGAIIVPVLHTQAVTEVILPLSGIARAIKLLVKPDPISFVFLPLPLVN